MSTDSMEVDNNTVNSKNDTDIDEGLYSRQLYVLGHEAMKRMGSSNILIVGLKGLGVEIAKNVILAGVKSVTLHDDEPATIADLTSQFFLTEKDVGKPRAKSVVEKLAELNNYVAVEVHTGKLTPEALSKFQVVVMVSQPFNLQLEVNEYCHNNGIRFISTDNKGVFSYIFDDFGKNFEVIDPNGEAPISLVITHVSQENPAIITVNEDQRIPFEDGDYVTFSEVMGMTELNSVVPRKIKILSHFTFSIEEDATKYSVYTGGGYATQVKKSITLDFLKLKESMENPEFLVSDFGKFDSPPQLHLGFLALDEFAKKNESLPHPHNDDHAKQVVEIAKQINSNLPKKLVEEVNEKLITSLSYVAQGDFAPLVAFLGGFAAQEVLKACSGKFTPIKQWFYFDAIEALPKDAPAEEFKPLGTRYDGQIITLGKTLHDKITQLSYFLVGAGAIGCEVLKIWAMMGLGTAQGSCIHVTDMDSIEKSNLNRQFLFRPKDVEQLKSTTAANAVKQMNPQLNVKAYSTRVGVETESVFNDAFFNSLFGVCNALDNIDARLYMDSRCVFYKKPLLESGTLGTKGNTQVVIPHLTESYASSRDPPEKSIPFCTLHHFPNTIEHCIQWARDLFEGFFRNQAETVNTYLSTPGFLESLQKQSGGMKLETLNILKKCLVDEKPANFDQCVVWARLKFEEYFNNNIQQLLYNFPLDMITSSGAPFWSGPKRAPKPIKFNPDDSTHLLFVIAAAKLRAENFGIKYSIDPAVVRKSVNNVVVPEFVPKKGVHITTNESDKKDQSQEQATEDDDEIIKKLLQEIPPPNKLAGYKMNPVEFEKDKDDNFHIDFITATANMRAANYSIPQADKHKCKGIAGKIIPAMVTTTAVVSGLVNIELVKLVQNRPITDFKNGFVNLALPFCAFSEPIAPPSTKVREGWSWTLWDRFEVDGDLTMKEFLDYFKNKHQLEITMISCGVSMIYAFYMGKDKLAERMNKKMTEVVSMVNKQPIPETKNHLTFEVCANRTEDDEEVDVPFVKLTFRK